MQIKLIAKTPKDIQAWQELIEDKLLYFKLGLDAISDYDLMTGTAIGIVDSMTEKDDTVEISVRFLDELMPFNIECLYNTVGRSNVETVFVRHIDGKPSNIGLLVRTTC